MLLLVLTAAAAAEQQCSCAQIVALETRLDDVVRELQAMKKQMTADATKTLPRATDGSHESVPVSVRGGQSSFNGRRLQAASPSYVAVDSWHVHEFPDGHTCPNMGASHKRLLATSADGAITWEPSPANPSANISLVSVAKDWTTSEVQRFPSPLRLVHDGSCTAPPKVLVDGVDVKSFKAPASSLACIRVVTTNQGYLNAWVNDERGEHNALDAGSSGIGSTWDKDTQLAVGTVIDGSANAAYCYSGFRGMRVLGPNSDAWRGSIEYTLDGGTTWTGLVCTDCTRFHNTADIAVDYDGSVGGDDTTAKCAGMRMCNLVLPSLQP